MKCTLNLTAIFLFLFLPPALADSAALGLRKYDIHDELTLNNSQAFNRQISEADYINCWQIFADTDIDLRTENRNIGLAHR